MSGLQQQQKQQQQAVAAAAAAARADSGGGGGGQLGDWSHRGGPVEMPAEGLLARSSSVNTTFYHGVCVTASLFVPVCVWGGGGVEVCMCACV